MRNLLFAQLSIQAAQFLLLPTADIRRVIEEMIPTLPGAVGGGPSTTITRGCLWAAVGVERGIYGADALRLFQRSPRRLLR